MYGGFLCVTRYTIYILIISANTVFFVFSMTALQGTGLYTLSTAYSEWQASSHVNVHAQLPHLR